MTLDVHDLAFTDVNGTPRIATAVLSQALGYATTRRLRHTVWRRRGELEQLGPLMVTERKYKTGRGNFRSGVEVLLTIEQAVFLATRRRGVGADYTLALLRERS